MMSLNSRKNFFIIDFFVSFIVVFGVVMFLPMFQSFQQIFGVGVSKISWLPNIGYLAMILFPSVAGSVMNKTGAKKSLLIFIILWIVGISVEILALTTVNYFLFCVGRLVEGLAEASFFPILLSMNKMVMKDEKDGKVGSSLLEIGSAIGGLIAAIVAGYFINSPRLFLIIPMIIGALTWVFIALSINEIKSGINIKQDTITKVKEGKWDYISLLFMIFMTQITFAASQVYLSYYMEAYNASSYTGLIISLEQILIAIGAMSPMLLLKRFSFKFIRNFMIVIFIIGSLVLSQHMALPVAIIALAVIALVVGIGFSTLSIFVSKVVVTNVSQKMSIYTAVRYLGGFLLSFLWGIYIDSSKASGHSYVQIFDKLYIWIVILVVIISIVIIMLQRNNKLWISKN
jgi:MFS family permease